MMTIKELKEEIKQYLKDNLRIDISKDPRRDDTEIKVSIILEGEIISDSRIYVTND